MAVSIEAMSKNFVSTFLLFLLLTYVSAQGYPSYSVNVSSSSSVGYYFLYAGSFTHPSTQMILDSVGQVVYYRSIPNEGADFKIQPNGLISYQKGSKFILCDSAFNPVDSFSCGNSILTDTHDFQVLPNGHVLLLGTENVNMDLSSYFMFGINHNLPGGANANVKCGVIQELDAGHNVVFEWHAKDHYSFNDIDTSRANAPNNVDWTHMNAVEMDTDSNLLVSVRHFGEITKINRSDSSIIWRLGGNANQFTFTNDPGKFKFQHDIRRIPNGNITLFDNGRFNPSLHPCAAKEYQLDENAMTATLVWSFQENPNSYSTAIGNTQRLANGNTVVDHGMTPLENRMFDVVDPAGNIVFEIEFADTLRSYRVFNYPVLPWQLPRPTISCINVNNQYYLDAGLGHASYVWSNGATTQTIPIISNDTFFVFVPIGNGGYISSENFIVTNLNDPCGITGVEPYAETDPFFIMSDASSNELTIHGSFDKNRSTTVLLFDAMGRLLLSKTETVSNDLVILSTDDLPEGIYIVNIDGTSLKFRK